MSHQSKMSSNSRKVSIARACSTEQWTNGFEKDYGRPQPLRDQQGKVPVMRMAYSRLRKKKNETGGLTPAKESRA